MRYLEGQRLGVVLENDVRILELALRYNWPPDVARRQDWRDLQLLGLMTEAKTKAEAEMKRRADERARRDRKRN